MTTQRRFDAVLFDLDGVLTDSEPWWNDVRIAFARAHDRPWTEDDQHAVMGANSAEWAATMQSRLRLDHVPVDVIEDAIVDGVVERYRTQPSPVIAGAPEAVRRIAATRPVAIASSSHRRVIDAAIDALGLHDVFGAVVSSDDVPTGKPAPDVYLRAAGILGVARDALRDRRGLAQRRPGRHRRRGVRRPRPEPERAARGRCARAGGPRARPARRPRS